MANEPKVVGAEPTIIDADPILTKDEARRRIFTNVQRDRRPITFRGVKLEILCPTVGDIEEMNELARAKDTTKRSFIMEIMTRFVVLPGTMDKVFETTDDGQIKTLPWNRDFAGILENWSNLTGTDFRKGEEEAPAE